MSDRSFLYPAVNLPLWNISNKKGLIWELQDCFFDEFITPQFKHSLHVPARYTKPVII